VDSFGQKLDAILAADLTNDALSQGSLDTIPLGPLATLMPLLQMAGQLNDPAIKRALKQVRWLAIFWLAVYVLKAMQHGIQLYFSTEAGLCLPERDCPASETSTTAVLASKGVLALPNPLPLLLLPCCFICCWRVPSGS
jgi:hypothetical protein